MATLPEPEAALLVSHVINNWRCGNRPDASDFLERHPDLLDQPSLVLDLAYEEYCLRREAGETVVLDTFCERFPTVCQPLRMLLAAHECTEEDGILTDDWDERLWPTQDSSFLGFRVRKELGRGTFARVYLATEAALGDRLVVIKVALWGAGEAETLGRLAHRNIVPVFSVQEDPGSHLTAVCMPYLGRSTLLHVLDRAFRQSSPPTRSDLIVGVASQGVQLDAIPTSYVNPDEYLLHNSYVDGVVHLAAQLADALAHSHEAGVCHRDLKPSNILLAPSGCPLLLDFNLSSDERLERTLVGGTLPYMPPEQLRSILTEDVEEESLGDPRGDIFSLGVILYQLLTGRLPFGEPSPEQSPVTAAQQILTRQQRGCDVVSSLNPAVDAPLMAILQRCLQLNPDQRFPSASELAAVLRTRSTRAAHMRRWVQRRRFLLTVSGAGLGLCAAGVGAGLARRPPFAIRRYQAGVTAFALEDYPRAIDCFTQASTAAPQAYQPLLARAQARVELHDYRGATDDMREAWHLAPNEHTAAWYAYCSQLKGETIPPIHYYRVAIREYDYEIPELLNNLALAHRARGFNPEAKDGLTRAIELDPKCQEAYLNRARVFSDYFREFNDQGESYRQKALVDIQRAVELRPDSALAHLLAALLHSQHNTTPDRDERTLYHLRRALECGADRTVVLHRSGIDSIYTQQLVDYARDARPVVDQSLLLIPPHVFPRWLASPDSDPTLASQ